MTLWLVMDYWYNEGDYEDRHTGSDFRGVFDDRDKALDAIRSFYAKDVKINAKEGLDEPCDYYEDVESGKISWYIPGEWDIDSYHVYYSVTEINVNETYDIHD